MWMAFVETDFGEVFRVIRPDGSTGGKALLSFLTTSAVGCHKGDSAEDGFVSWINDFNENTKIDFCTTVERINRLYYSGKWDYQDDEYEFFLHRSPGSEMSDLDFQRAIKEVRKMWANIHDLITDIRILVGEFRKGYLKETDWYLAEDTMGDFEGLLNTLILAEERDAKEVRIRID